MSPEVPPVAVPTPGLRSLGREPGLDGLRALAVLVVFVSHLEVFLPIRSLLVIPGGTIGLEPFFVLSGFLITALLLKEQANTGKIRRWEFYKRRIVRLLPPLFFLLIANVILALLTHGWTDDQIKSLLSVSFYYSNYYVAHSPNAFCANLAPGYQHLWSLSFEEQFYLVWPWVIIFFLTIKRDLKIVVPVLMGLIVLIGVHRAIAYQGIQSWCYLFHATEDRADALLWGCLAAHLWVRRKEHPEILKWLVWPAAAFLVACLPFSNLTGPFLYRGGLDAIDLSSTIVLLALLGDYWVGQRLFRWKPFVALGLVAYGFYLWHLTVFYVVAHIDKGWNYGLRVVVALTGTLTMTLLSWFLLERPLQRWVHRISPRVRQSASSDTGPAVPSSSADAPTLGSSG